LWPASSWHCNNAARQDQNGPFAAPKPVWVWDPWSNISHLRKQEFLVTWMYLAVSNWEIYLSIVFIP
jgi:hypothetical protein